MKQPKARRNGAAPALSLERWYTVREIALLLHRAPKTIRSLLKPYRTRCRLAREGRNPRRVLYIPESVARQVEAAVFHM